MQSDKGFPYSRLFLITGISIFSLMLVLVLLNLDSGNTNEPDWTYFLMMGVMVLFFGIVGAFMFPNTATIRILEDDIEVIRGSKKERIPISTILLVTESTSFTNQLFNNVSFYSVKLKSGSSFGTEIYYKVNWKSKDRFTAQLKKQWVKSKRSSTAKSINVR